jgi:hypothetical protein
MEKELGIGIGNILALVISYAKWHSIFWAVVHGILGWLYVLYYAVMYL